MHPSSKENMEYAYEKYIDLPLGACVLDVGGRGLKGDRSYSKIFAGVDAYDIADIVDGEGVTHVMTGPYSLPGPDNFYDLVVSGQTLEHVSNPFRLVAEMKRVLRPGGTIVIIAPSAGPRHDKQDCWRFMDDAFKAIAEEVGLEVVADWITANAPDTRSRKWQDHVFVGRKP